MVQFAGASSYLASGLGFASLSEGLAVVESGGYLRLVYADRNSNSAGVLTLAAADSGAATSAANLGAPDGGGDLAVQATAAGARLYIASAWAGDLRTASLAANGSLGAASTVLAGASGLANVTALEVVERAAGDLAAVALRGQAGLRLYALSDSGTASLLADLPDSAKTYLGTVADLATVTLGGQSYLLALSASESGLTSYALGADGTPTLVDALGAANGLPVWGCAGLSVVQSGGQSFAVIASTGSSSLTVVRVNEMGVLFQTDHLTDDRTTRFAGASALDSFEWQGRDFLVVGGSDAGLTLVELVPGGRLEVMAVVGMETGEGLGNVTGIEVAVWGGAAHVFVTDARGDRILQQTIALTGLGGIITATAGTLTSGTAAEDRILGSTGADTIAGGAGADRISDGAGLDVLRGEAGADVFLLSRDGTTDRIEGFEQGQDRIDIGDWGRIYSTAGLTISQTASGAVVIYGDERLDITSAGGGPLVLTDADFLF